MPTLRHAKEILNTEIGGNWSARHDEPRKAHLGWEGFGFFIANFNIKYAQALQKHLAGIDVTIEVPDSGEGLVAVKLTKNDFDKIKAHSFEHDHPGQTIRWKIEDELKIPHAPTQEGGRAKK